MQTWPSPISKISHPISILPSSKQAIFTGIPAWKPVAASGLNVFEIRLSVPSSLQKYALSQYKEMPPSFLVSWAWSTLEEHHPLSSSAGLLYVGQNSSHCVIWNSFSSIILWINIERFSPSRANFDLIWNLSARGVFPYTEHVTSFLLHTAEMQVLARWSYTTGLAPFLRHLPVCSKLSLILCDPASVQQGSAPARLNGLCSAEEFVMWGEWMPNLANWLSVTWGQPRDPGERVLLLPGCPTESCH